MPEIKSSYFTATQKYALIEVEGKYSVTKNGRLDKKTERAIRDEALRLQEHWHVDRVAFMGLLVLYAPAIAEHAEEMRKEISKTDYALDLEIHVKVSKAGDCNRYNEAFKQAFEQSVTSAKQRYTRAKILEKLHLSNPKERWSIAHDVNEKLEMLDRLRYEA